MKNVFIYITIISIFSFNSFAQQAKTSRIEKKEDAIPKASDTLVDAKSTNRTIRSYRVEENVNQRFGGYTLTYEVLDAKLIDTYDLGPNNTRVVKPSYKETKSTPNPQIESLKAQGISTTQNEIKPTDNNILIPAPKEEIKETPKATEKEVAETTKKNNKYIYVHLIKVYERIAEKGYKSIEIFQKLGDSFFFDGEYTKAARWYGELFKMTTELDSQYYNRYAHSLNVIGEKDKSSEILQKRQQLFNRK